MALASAAQDASDSTLALLRRRQNAVEVLTLNRPQARNALSEALLRALGTTLAEISEDRAVRAVVISASGPAFSAGHDLKELTARRNDTDGGRAHFKQLMDGCSAVMQMVQRLSQPVIAAVEGIASAAGCQLVASCDLAIAGQEARFVTPGVDIGLFCSTPMVALSRTVPRKAAMQMLLTGEPISAQEAQRIGLINQVVPAGAAEAAALALAEQIASKARAVVKLGKETFYRQAEMDLASAYAFASEVMTENLLAADAVEGIGAFVEKRRPRWQE